MTTNPPSIYIPQTTFAGGKNPWEQAAPRIAPVLGYDANTVGASEITQMERLKRFIAANPGRTASAIRGSLGIKAVERDLNRLVAYGAVLVEHRQLTGSTSKRKYHHYFINPAHIAQSTKREGE